MLRGGAFKPRTSPYSFQGLGADGPGAPAGGQAGDRPAHRHRDHERQRTCPSSRMVDVIQVGARNMQNFDLLKELGQMYKPVLLKRGLANTYRGAGS